MKMEVNKIFNEDCLKGLKDIPSKSVDLLVTDPPYCVGTTSNGQKADWLDNNLVLPFFRQLLDELKRVLRDTGEFYIHTDWRTYPFLYYPIVQLMPIKNLIVWDYGWIKAGTHYRFTHEFIIYGMRTEKNPRKFSASEQDVWNDKPMNFTAKDKRHNTEKPITLALRMIRNSSREGDTVLDPFAGVGTTLVAAKRLNRNFIGYELNPEYFAIAKKRIDEESQQVSIVKFA